jgi:uncharacterized membrane protein
MSAASQTSFLSPPLETPFARAMAFAAYFLLLAALPTFGFGAVLGLIIAYARRDASTPLIRSHHRFQIRIFWVGVALAAAALALGASAGIDAWRAPAPRPLHIQRSPDAQTIAYRPGDEPRRPKPAAFYHWSYESPGMPQRAILEGYAAMATVAVAGLWGIFTPLWGAARLASRRPMGHSAP